MKRGLSWWLQTPVYAFRKFMIRTGAFQKRLVYVRIRWLLKRQARRSALVPISTPHKILWVNLNHIGDVLMDLPAISVLQWQYPGAEIDLLVSSPVGPILEQVPFVRKSYLYKAPFIFGGNEPAANFLGAWLLFRSLRKCGYEVAIEVTGRDRNRLACFWSGAVRRVGIQGSPLVEDAPIFSYINCEALMTQVIQIPNRLRHESENALDILRGASLIPPDAEMESFRLEASAEQRQSVQETLGKLGVSRPLAVIHAFSQDPRRLWRSERWAVVADYLSGRGMDVLLIGAAGDASYNQSIAALAQERILDGTSRFPLASLPALFERTVLAVTIDSGPMHVASLVGTRVVSLFLPCLAPIHHPYLQEANVLTASEVWNLNDYVHSPAVPRMDTITVEAVIEVIERVLGPSDTK
jgi:ADP-heptose:LPS heptosyltransferase